ncbi:type II toxin-antitoxin system RelE/ParE family toxin [Caulobacter soli]|uniref:type II toxin-antitoxin system RelE/ParE family toxin n=1 Tax=Caulobacter soli TaxID=2708539 RepID=UPI0013EC7D98|nr:type II toxin-antitoxin system RelE/ParE family toxin [Caulobacter soli]
MSRRLVVTRRAQRDLKRIGDDIAADSPRAAERFVSTLRANLEKLAPFPFAAQAVGDHPRFRRLPYGAYVVFYEVTDDEVLIRAIEHSATLK